MMTASRPQTAAKRAFNALFGPEDRKGMSIQPVPKLPDTLYIVRLRRLHARPRTIVIK